MKTNKLLVQEFQKYLIAFIAGVVAYYFALEIIFFRNSISKEVIAIFRTPSSMIIYFAVIIFFLLATFAIYYFINFKMRNETKK